MAASGYHGATAKSNNRRSSAGGPIRSKGLAKQGAIQSGAIMR
jgi:hypothetical protein